MFLLNRFQSPQNRFTKRPGHSRVKSCMDRLAKLRRKPFWSSVSHNFEKARHQFWCVVVQCFRDSVHGVFWDFSGAHRCVATPNDPKLSDRGGAARHLPHGWNVGQATKLRRRVERRVAGAVTRRSGSLQRMVRRRWFESELRLRCKGKDVDATSIQMSCFDAICTK